MNIEEDFITSNSNVVYRQLKAPNFIYQDRHGNWIVGKKTTYKKNTKYKFELLFLGIEVGTLIGYLRSNPKKGRNMDCPYQVQFFMFSG